MTTRLLSALLAAVFLWFAPVAVGVAVAAEGENLEYGDDHGSDEDQGDEGGDHELRNMDNGDPADKGAQALAGARGSGAITVMMWVAGGVVLVLLVGGLALGRGENA